MGSKVRRSRWVFFFVLLLAVALRPLAVLAQDSRLTAAPSHRQVADLHLKVLGETQESVKDLFHLPKNSKDHPDFTAAAGCLPSRLEEGLLVPADAAPCPAGGPVRCPLALRI